MPLIQEAIPLIQKAVELDPGSSIIGIVLGASYASQGLYTLAERQFKNILQRDPEFAQAYRSLAALEAFRLGNFDHALEYIHKAIVLDPGNISGISMLIGINEQLGDVKSAEAALRKMESLDSNHPITVIATIFTSLSKDISPAATRELINWAFPIVEKAYSGKVNVMGFIELTLNNTQLARELYLAAEPRWLEPDQWEQLINANTTAACIVSWLLINTGDEQLGTALLTQNTVFLDEALPAVIEHADNFRPEICHLTSGDTEKALKSIETQLAHNHLLDWPINHRLPMYDLIRFEPRYQAALAERGRRIAEQVERIEAKRANGANL